MSKVTTYIKEARQELGKVVWPSRQVLVTHTVLVIGVSIALAVFIGAADYLFTFGLEQYLRLR